MDLELRTKIIELFEYRQLPQLMTYGGAEMVPHMYEQLIDLQFHIYKLDHELERNWTVSESIISERWNSIYRSLSNLDIPSSSHDAFCKHIYKYQKHELDIREMKLPTRLSMEYFYFYKSCDVKLLRRIIYKYNPSVARDIKVSEWRLFDLVTEINDDVSDLQEDVTTINGNRFLISLKLLGPDKTYRIFSDFLKEIAERNGQANYHPSLIDIQAWTETQVEETLRLMEDQIAVFDQLDTSLYDRFKVADFVI